MTMTAWVTSLGFGLLMGLMIGGQPTDRPTIRTVLQAVTALGGILWLTRPTSGTKLAVAAVAMSLGGLASLVGLTLRVRFRRNPRAG